MHRRREDVYALEHLMVQPQSSTVLLPAKLGPINNPLRGVGGRCACFGCLLVYSIFWCSLIWVEDSIEAVFLSSPLLHTSLRSWLQLLAPQTLIGKKIFLRLFW